MKKREYFKIEEFSPERVDQESKKLRIVYDFRSLRKHNKEMRLPLNSGLPLFPEETNLIKEMYSQGKPLEEILSFFQRPENSIKKILEVKSISREIFEQEHED